MNEILVASSAFAAYLQSSALAQSITLIESTRADHRERDPDERVRGRRPTAGRKGRRRALENDAAAVRSAVRAHLDQVVGRRPELVGHPAVGADAEVLLFGPHITQGRLRGL